MPDPRTRLQIWPPVGANQSQRPTPLGPCTVFNQFRCVLLQCAKNLIAFPSHSSAAIAGRFGASVGRGKSVKAAIFAMVELDDDFSGCRRLRGGAGRTRTNHQSVMEHGGVRPAHLVEHQVPTATSPVVGGCLNRSGSAQWWCRLGGRRLPSCGEHRDFPCRVTATRVCRNAHQQRASSSSRLGVRPGEPAGHAHIP